MRAPLAKCYRRGAHPVRLPPERRVRPQELALLQVRAPREGLPPPRPDPFARARVTPEVRPCERVSNRRVWSGCGGQALGARASAKLVALRRPCGHCAGARRRASPVSFRGAKQGSTSHSGVPALCLTSYTAQLLHSSGADTHRLRTCPPLPPSPPYRSPGSARTSSPRSPNRRSTALARHPCERLRPRNSVPSPALHSTRPSAAPTLLPCCPPPPRRALLGRGRARRALTRKTIETATSFSAIQFPATRTFSVGIYFR